MLRGVGGGAGGPQDIQENLLRFSTWDKGKVAAKMWIKTLRASVRIMNNFAGRWFMEFHFRGCFYKAFEWSPPFYVERDSNSMHAATTRGENQKNFH